MLSVALLLVPMFYYEAFHVECYLASCPHVLFLVLCSIVTTSLGNERAGPHASRAFVCLSCMRYVLSFSLFLCVGFFLLSIDL